MRPGVYLSAVGRRSIAMGTEDGRFELWSWPIKWLHDFELAFRVPKYVEPIAGPSVARRMTERPEAVTIDYAYETFTVRQHVFVPLNVPAVIMLLEVDAVRPLDIIARFTPDIHFAWPASLGGQYLVWNEDAKAFLFSESRRKINAFLGSPAVTQASDVPAHMLSAERPQLVLGVGSAADRYTAPKLGEPPGKNVNLHVAYIPIVLAGGEMPRDSALALYRRLIEPGAAEQEWRKRVAHADSLRHTMFSLHSPDSLLNRAVEYAKINLDESYVCNPDLGCGLVAGYGPSGAASDRPGFGWFFGGDASINALAMTGSGLGDLVRQGTLRFFAKYQRADGKITHEISQGAGKVDWFGQYPYAFYHGDTTPFWILAFGEYWKQTADTALVRELFPNLRRAFQWSRATDRNGDGLMENPSAGAGALEVGDLQIGILSDVYMSGVWIAALDRFARMADAMGEKALAASARSLRATAMRTLETRLWLPEQKQYAFALLEDGSVNRSLTAWPATAMSFDVFDAARGADMAALLASSEIMTDWGARPLASSSPLFDPLHYNNGAVWPFVTGWVALAQYRYHNAAAGKFALDAIARTTFDESRGRNPEVISGRLYKPLDTAVPQQFFATSMILTPLIRGLLGIDVDAPAGTFTLAPHLPADWDSVRVENIPVGAGTIDVRVNRTSATWTANIQASGLVPPLDVAFSPALALGSTSPLPVTSTAGDVHATARGRVTGGAPLTLTVPYYGLPTFDVRSQRASIGERSQAARLVSDRIVDHERVLSFEGLPRRPATLEARAPASRSTSRLIFPDTHVNAGGYVSTKVVRSMTPHAAGQPEPARGVTRSAFGKLPDGTQVDAITISNGRGTTVNVITYGAIITSIIAADRSGNPGDIVLGYDGLDGYLKDSPYFGAIVGRYANRIAKGRFTLDGATFQLPVNNGPNSLHGGTRGFDKVVWDAKPFETDSSGGVTLTYVSPDGDQGYPGRVDATVTYTLDERNRLSVDYRATTDKATVINLSQHSYFNLAGATRDILDHQLWIDADRYTPVDSTLIPTGELAPVNGTPFDFRTSQAIGGRIGQSNEQLRFGGGYDHNWVLKGAGMRHAARLSEPTSGRTLDIFTDQPGLQFYSGNFLDGSITGKSGHVYRHRFGLCLETQHFPDSPNHPAFPSTVLRPGETYQTKTVFAFGVAP